MKAMRVAVVAFALITTAASAVSAQYESSDRSPIGLRVAVFRPTDSVLKNLSKNWLGPVIDYNARFDKKDRPEIKATFGWFGEDKGIDKASYLPVTATYIKRYYKENSDRCWFAGGGAGIYLVSYRHVVPTGPFSNSLVKDRGTEFGLNVVGGYETGPWFLELRYDLTSGLGIADGGSVDFSGLTVSLGTNIAF